MVSKKKFAATQQSMLGTKVCYSIRTVTEFVKTEEDLSLLVQASMSCIGASLSREDLKVMTAAVARVVSCAGEALVKIIFIWRPEKLFHILAFLISSRTPVSSSSSDSRPMSNIPLRSRTTSTLSTIPIALDLANCLEAPASSALSLAKSGSWNLGKISDRVVLALPNSYFSGCPSQSGMQVRIGASARETLLHGVTLWKRCRYQGVLLPCCRAVTYGV